MKAQELSYLKRFNREWDELLSECSRYKHKCEKLEQENRELKEKLLTFEARCGILEERERQWTKGDRGLFTGSVSVSSSGANKLKKEAFRSTQARNNHWKDHGNQYINDGITTAEQYEKRAVELAESATNENIFGHLDKDNHIVRYDHRTNDFVKADIVKGVITMYKPDDGIKYYENIRRGDIEHGGQA